MKYISPRAAAEAKISVTTSVANLFAWVNTAGSTNNSQNYYERDQQATVIRISPEDGSIRWLVGVNPTTALGNLIPQGATVDIVGVNLSDLRLISTSGTVACSIQFIAASESAAIVGSSVSGGASSVAISSALPAGTNVIGKVGLAAQTSGGYTPSKTISLASTNATVVKGSAGQIGGIIVSNINAAVRYLKLYNKATSPTVGTDVPVATIPIPGNTEGRTGGISIDVGIEFTTGIGFALTTGVADNDTGAVSANEHVVNIFYK